MEPLASGWLFDSVLDFMHPDRLHGGAGFGMSLKQGRDRWANANGTIS
jgi:hypothetical protein